MNYRYPFRSAVPNAGFGDLVDWLLIENDVFSSCVKENTASWQCEKSLVLLRVCFGILSSSKGRKKAPAKASSAALANLHEKP